MSPVISEHAFEESIECGLLAAWSRRLRQAPLPVSARSLSGPTATRRPASIARRRPEDYDRALCLIPRDVIDFILATQPKAWEKLKQHHGAAVRGAVPESPCLGDRAARRARRAAQRHQGLGRQVPARLLPPGERAQRGDAAASTRRTCSPSCASSATARRTRTVSTSCCFSTACRFSPPRSRTHSPGRMSRTPSASTRPTATRASRSSRMAAASRISPWTRTSST